MKFKGEHFSIQFITVQYNLSQIVVIYDVTKTK